MYSLVLRGIHVAAQVVAGAKQEAGKLAQGESGHGFSVKGQPRAAPGETYQSHIGAVSGRPRDSAVGYRAKLHPPTTLNVGKPKRQPGRRCYCVDLRPSRRPRRRCRRPTTVCHRSQGDRRPPRPTLRPPHYSCGRSQSGMPTMAIGLRPMAWADAIDGNFLATHGMCPCHSPQSDCRASHSAMPPAAIRLPASAMRLRRPAFTDASVGIFFVVDGIPDCHRRLPAGRGPAAALGP